MSLLLSIDVGIKNLAMCLIHSTSGEIVEWDVSGVPPGHADGLFVCMRDHLRERPWTLNAKTVLIEKQPDKNRGMKGVQNFLHAYFVNEEINKNWLPQFESSKKKDDLADTYLQAMSYINRREIAPKTKKTNKIHPRRPTSHQKDTKYSKSNIIWFMKDLGMEKFKKNKRVIKDMGRYFKSPEEVLRILNM